MSTGGKDWVARTDVLLQSLSELIVRPKYGERGMIEFAGNVNASGETSLGEIYGKGIVYGGALIVAGVGTCGLDAVGSAVDDGPHYYTTTLGQAMQFSLFAQHGVTWQLECADEVNFYYALSLAGGITFEEKLEFFYKEGAGRNPYVQTALMYAVI